MDETGVAGISVRTPQQSPATIRLSMFGIRRSDLAACREDGHGAAASRRGNLRTFSVSPTVLVQGECYDAWVTPLSPGMHWIFSTR